MEGRGLSSRLKEGKATFLRPGEFGETQRRIARMVDPDTASVFYYTSNNDPNMRVGPFIDSDIRMPNCGIRTVGGSVYQAGFKNTRVVLGPWNRNFDFRKARVGGRVPQIFGIGSMQLHAADAHKKIRQATELGDDRPLIIGGGPHAIHQAWDYFNRNPKDSADVAVKGEANVILSLLETILDHRGRNETMLGGFERARREGALDKIPGLVYISEDRGVLIDTGAPLQVGDLDELPLEIVGLSLLEPRHDGMGLSASPVPLNKLKEQGARVVSMITSAGCNFNCSYCSIPGAYQYSIRARSPEGLVENIKRVIEKTGIGFVFGTADNDFAFGENYLVPLYEAMAGAKVMGRAFKDMLFFGTEATLHQADLYGEYFPLMRAGGLRALWMGIEDLTAGLVNKGQTAEKTVRAFKAMNANGVSPMIMLMHHDEQPLQSGVGTLEGLVNQVKFMYKHGAGSVQITYNSPSIGSRGYEEHFSQGTVLERAGFLDIGPGFLDGNHVVSTRDEDKVGRQDNLLRGYETFYNWGNLLKAGWRYAISLVGGDRAARDVAEVALVFQRGGIRDIKISLKNSKEWRDSLASRVYRFAQSAPKSAIPIIEAA